MLHGYRPVPERFKNDIRILTSVDLDATKTLEGRKLEENEFSFELRDASGRLIETKSCDGNGVVAFDQLRFDCAGTYANTITEEQGSEENVTYDERSYTATVRVSEAADGTLTADETVYALHGEEAKTATFENTYGGSGGATPRPRYTAARTTTRAATPKTADAALPLGSCCSQAPRPRWQGSSAAAGRTFDERGLLHFV